jgi:hypothetical protein
MGPEELSSAKDTRVLVITLAVVFLGRKEGRRCVGVILPDVEVEGDLGLRAGEPFA